MTTATPLSQTLGLRLSQRSATAGLPSISPDCWSNEADPVNTESTDKSPRKAEYSASKAEGSRVAHRFQMALAADLRFPFDRAEAESAR